MGSFFVHSAAKTAARYVVMRVRLGKHNTKIKTDGGVVRFSQ